MSIKVKINPNIKKDIITRLKIAGTLAAFMVTGSFAARQIRLCRKANTLENKINASLSKINHNDKILNVAAHRGFCSLEVENTKKATAGIHYCKNVILIIFIYIIIFCFFK